MVQYNESLWVDGVLSNSYVRNPVAGTSNSININRANSFFIGGVAKDSDGSNTPQTASRFYVATLRVHDGALTPDQIANNAALDLARVPSITASATATATSTASASKTATLTRSQSSSYTSTPSQTRSGSATETFAPPNCKQEAWRRMVNTDIDGVDIAVNLGVYSARECQLSCCTYFNPPCTAYVFSKYDNVCILRTNATVMMGNSLTDVGLLASVYT